MIAQTNVQDPAFRIIRSADLEFGLLRRSCTQVQDIETEVLPYVGEMIRLMEDDGGIGLAAPQVGIGKCFFIANLMGAPEVVINPKILKKSDKMDTKREGCLSIPGLWIDVPRPRKIKVQYTGADGMPRKYSFSDREARVFCHEFDHLLGVLITDYTL